MIFIFITCAPACAGEGQNAAFGFTWDDTATTVESKAMGKGWEKIDNYVPKHLLEKPKDDLTMSLTFLGQILDFGSCEIKFTFYKDELYVIFIMNTTNYGYTYEQLREGLESKYGAPHSSKPMGASGVDHIWEVGRTEITLSVNHDLKVVFLSYLDWIIREIYTSQRDLLKQPYKKELQNQL